MKSNITDAQWEMILTFFRNVENSAITQRIGPINFPSCSVIIYRAGSGGTIRIEFRPTQTKEKS